MKSKIYMDGYPVEKIGVVEMKLSEDDARMYSSDEMAGPFYATGGVLPGSVKFNDLNAMELVVTLSMGPKKIMEIISESTKLAIEAFRAMAEAAKEVEKQLVVWGTLDQTVEEYAAELRAINPRWYHMSNHAGKARVRKKYQNRLMRVRARQKKVAGV